VATATKPEQATATIAALLLIAQQQSAARDTLIFPRIQGPGTVAGQPVPDEGPGRASQFPQALARPGPAGLLAVLAGQAVFAAHLLRANTAFSDEALYLWGGHLEWAHLLHGEPLPAFPAYFSGAPVVYPPLGALADAAGGLAGARALSLFFMLGATALLYATASRLCGRRAGVLAAALWAFLGPTLHLSAFATYDAMALFLMALSAWCAVKAAGDRDAAGWIFAAALALALANATAYSSAIFDPVVVAVAFLAGGQQIRVAGLRAAALTAYTAALLVLGLTAGGGLYYAGLTQTVLSRVASDVPPGTVLAQAAGWTVAVVLPALAGALIAARCEPARRKRLLLAVLAGAALLVPLEQARIRTGTSLDKHADMGAWFAAIVAGYALAKGMEFASRARWQKIAATGACAVLLLAPARAGWQQGEALFTAWPDVTPFIGTLRPLLARTDGPVLVETSPIAEYYLPQGHQWQRWSSTFAIMFRDGHGEGPGVGQVFGMAVYAPLVREGYWSLIALNFGSSSWGLDRQLAAMLNHDPAYVQVATVPYGTGHLYIIWRRVA
jgi:4-amino-4-deoxy-L-arabinose transferase-like glycosyltransferase